MHAVGATAPQCQPCGGDPSSQAGSLLRSSATSGLQQLRHIWALPHHFPHRHGNRGHGGTCLHSHDTRTTGSQTVARLVPLVQHGWGRGPLGGRGAGKGSHFCPPTAAHLIRLWAFLQKEIILLISKARGPLAPPGPACRVPSSILGRKSLAKGLPTLQPLPSCKGQKHQGLEAGVDPWPGSPLVPHAPQLCPH